MRSLHCFAILPFALAVCTRFRFRCCGQATDVRFLRIPERDRPTACGRILPGAPLSVSDVGALETMLSVLAHTGQNAVL